MPGTVTFRFENFALDTGRGVLLRDGEEVSLRRQSYEVLVYLVANEGRLVTREELLEALWPGKVVTDASITQCLVDIRAALDDSEHEKIRTLTRRGYRFELPVTEIEEPDPPAVTAGGPGSSAHAALGRWGWSLGAAAAFAVLALWWAAGQRKQPAPPQEPGATANALVIAALPFENLTASAEDTRFLSGFHDVLMTELGRYPDLRLIARWSIEALPDEGYNPEQLRDVLGADLVLTGSMSRDPERIRFTFQLHETATGQQAWAESFEQRFDADAMISLQRTVAEKVAREAVQAASGNTALAATRSPIFPATDSLEAYEHYLAGLVYARHIETWDTSPETVAAGRRAFEAAMAADPDWAPPYAALGRILHFTGSRDRSSEVWQESRDLINRALALDPEFGPALTSFAYLQYRFRDDLIAAERAYLKAQAAGDSMADWGLAMLYAKLGYTEAALAHYRAAIASDPLNDSIRRQYGGVLGCDHQWRRAAKALAAVAERLDEPQLQLELALYEILAGDRKAGLDRYERYRTHSDDLEGFLHLALGDREAARSVLDVQMAEKPLPTAGATLLAAKLGDVESALDILEQRVEADPESVNYVLCYRDLRELEGHPRFDQMLVDLGLRGPRVPPPPF